jgi:phosphonate degradation associated HDIG domain protein
MMSAADDILAVFNDRGSEQYFGENVSQLEHALQAARLAQIYGCPEPLIIAALLHDVGHLVHESGEDIADRGIDTRHEALGEAWLARHFGPEITEPIRLHVDAKRYLCAVEPEYLKQLSAASVQSLKLQGGPMNPDEVKAFEANPYFQEAVTLRRFDDEAKVVGMETPSLGEYRNLVSRALGN